MWICRVDTNCVRFSLKDKSKENRMVRQQGKVDRHGNIEDMNKTEHNSCSYKTKNKHTAMKPSEPTEVK